MSSEASKKKLELATQIGQMADTEEITKERTLWKRRRVFGTWANNQIAPQPEVVTDAYMYSQIFDARFYERKLLQIFNRHATYSLTYKVQASLDGVTWQDISVEIAVAGSGSDQTVLTDAWAFLRFVAKNTTNGQAAFVEGYIGGQQ